MKREKMSENCVPYPRKRLYLWLTIPMIAMYIAIAVFLWQISPIIFWIYLGLFISVAISQSYVCVYWQCPYVGRFAPCVGGFCLPASQIARFFKGVKRTERAYNVMLTVALVSFLGIIVLPVYFLYGQGLLYLFGYLGIVLAYAASFLGWICPECGTRQVCPGGQTATKLREMISGEGRVK